MPATVSPMQVTIVDHGSSWCPASKQDHISAQFHICAAIHHAELQLMDPQISAFALDTHVSAPVSSGRTQTLP